VQDASCKQQDTDIERTELSPHSLPRRPLSTAYSIILRKCWLRSLLRPVCAGACRVVQDTAAEIMSSVVPHHITPHHKQYHHIYVNYLTEYETTHNKWWDKLLCDVIQYLNTIPMRSESCGLQRGPAQARFCS
jgi:hypothetical protein